MSFMDSRSELERAARSIPIRSDNPEHPADKTAVFWSDDGAVKLAVDDAFYNIVLQTPAQVQALIDALTEALGWFITEEGGE